MERHRNVIALLRQASVLLFVEVPFLSLEALPVFLQVLFLFQEVPCLFLEVPFPSCSLLVSSCQPSLKPRLTSLWGSLSDFELH